MAVLDGEVTEGFLEEVLLGIIGRCLLGPDLFIWAFQSMTLSLTWLGFFLALAYLEEFSCHS